MTKLEELLAACNVVVAACDANLGARDTAAYFAAAALVSAHPNPRAAANAADVRAADDAYAAARYAYEAELKKIQEENSND
jgi:hypothetical protein